MTLADTASSKAAKLVFKAGRYVTRGIPRSGGVAQVYRATDVETGETVAIKVLQTGENTDGVIEESFRREVEALSDLRHQNIVKIIDSGRDEDNGAHFIVMEWVELDLGTVCRQQPFPSWEDFHRTIGRGVLEALVFAHTRSIVHRDIKPSNILVTSDGQTKLCDFGISKIRTFLAPGITLSQFASAPYAPPEPDDGSYSFSRDAYGFAALSIASVSHSLPKTHAELLESLGNAVMPEGVRAVFRRCLSQTNPQDRPQNAVMLMKRLREALPIQDNAPSECILVQSTNRIRDLLNADMGIRGVQLDKFLESDLDGSCCEDLKPTPEKPGRAVRLIGSQYGYTAVPDESGSKLTLVSAVEYSPSDLERRRANSCESGCRFKTEGIRFEDSASALSALFDRIAEFETDQKLRYFEKRQQSIFNNWLGLLNAKTELEKKRRSRLRYERKEVTGEFVRLTFAPGEDLSSLADQDVTVETLDRLPLYASVVAADETTAVLRPTSRNQIDFDLLPESGHVEIDTTKSDVALDKQRNSLEAVRHGRSVNPDLGRQLIDAGSIVPPPLSSIQFIEQNIDEDKKDAVVVALSAPPLMIVQGPPGTGKTTLITELVLQTLKANPNSRILLTSQTHVALDNSLERIVAKGGKGLRALRIGNDGDDRISAGSRSYLLDNQIPIMRKEALASGRAFIEQWATEHGLTPADVRKSMALESLAVLKSRIDELDKELIGLAPKLGVEGQASFSEEERTEFEDRFQGLRKERDDLSRRVPDTQKEVERHVENKEELKEFSECSAEDLRSWANAYANRTPAGVQLKKMLVAHALWETRFGRNREFLAALASSAQVIAGTCLGVMSVPGSKEIVFDLCIVDEASIATPTEVLVPMSRARRTVLVGDRRQLSPFQDPELKERGLLEKYSVNEADQKETLFNLLSDSLPSLLHKELTTQHRMLPALGDLISQCFYEGKLKSVDRKPVDYLASLTPKPVTWYSTSGKPHHGSRLIGKSSYNDLEVSECVAMLTRIDFRISKSKARGKKLSVALLTGYSEQKRRLKAAVDVKRHEWESFSEIFVNVVDAFQGREADLVIFSVTRSEAKNIGFLKEMERINVALSRAREVLVVVGDHVYCQGVSGAVNPLRDVIDHIRANPADCLLEELAR